jgi:hypothetical protein
MISGSKFSGYQVAMPEKLVPLAGSLGLSGAGSLASQGEANCLERSKLSA